MAQKTCCAVNFVQLQTINLPFAGRSSPNLNTKMTVARESGKHIKEGGRIVIYSGTSTFEIAKLFTNYHNLFIATKSLPTATTLRDYKIFVVFLCYVQFDRNLSTQAPLTNEGLVKFEINSIVVCNKHKSPYETSLCAGY